MKLPVISDKARLFLYFITLSFIGSIVLQLPVAYVNGNPEPYVDALFTSVSALCVTGLSTLDMGVYTNVGFFFILLLIELGGLGILTFISLYLALPSKKVSLVSRRSVKEFFVDDVEINPRTILANILSFTLTIQLVGAALLVPFLYANNSESPIFHSIFLSVSAFCNAGFSPYSDSLVKFNNSGYINVVIALLIISGGLGFIVIKNIFQVVLYKKKHLSLHSIIVLLTTLFLIVSGILVTLCTEWNHALAGLAVKEKISAAFFQSVTTRTAGFETIPQAQFSLFTNLYSIFLMFIGGSPGSIAGGVKTTTIFLVFMYALFGNDEIINLQIFKRKINTKTTGKALLIITQSLLIIAASICLLAISEHTLIQQGKISFLDIVFETVSAFATVGLSRGITAQLTLAGKIIIVLTMFIGRTGLFAMVLRFKQDRTKSLIQYAEESVLVG